MLHRTRLLVLLMAALLAGCTLSSGRRSLVAPSRYNEIVLEEFQEGTYRNALHAIRALRPGWVDGRGRASLGGPAAAQPVVYIDGTRAGGLGVLQQILASDVQLAQYLGATEAAARFGLNHGGGAILITTRR